MTKEEIFDWIVTFEDQALENMREDVIKTAEYNFGELGRKVATKYYKQIDGEEDFDNLDVDDCKDCKERAKKLIENTENIKLFSELLMSDTLNLIVKDVDCSKIITEVKKLSEKLKKDTCFDIDVKTIQQRVLLQTLKEIK